MLGVLKLVEPLKSNKPSVGSEYQSTVSPAPAVADRLIEIKFPHAVPLLPDGADGLALKVLTRMLSRKSQPYAVVALT